MCNRGGIVTPSKVNYLNNRDLLKEIHNSKITYCSFQNKDTDHQYDIILPSVEKINRLTVSEAKRLKADRLKKEGIAEIDPKKISHTDLVFRVPCLDHIPLAVPKEAKTKTKKINITDVFDFSDISPEVDDVINDDNPISTKYVVLNFPPFYHYRLDENKIPYIVGKSHWSGDLESGEFCQTHGQITNKLGMMFMKLCERYSSKGNWRSYSYVDEMRNQALLQLSISGLKFDESKGSNPFAYFTCCVTNAFRRILNNEKVAQNLRDDLLEANGLNPSWSRQQQGVFEAQLKAHNSEEH